jgi:hypothetical protein
VKEDASKRWQRHRKRLEERQEWKQDLAETGMDVYTNNQQTGRIGQDRIEQDRTGQDRTGQDRTGQDRTGQDR